MFFIFYFFFFKQKTAYEMRISDWSSDVCSSDLRFFRPGLSHPGYGVSQWSIAHSARGRTLGGAVHPTSGCGGNSTIAGAPSITRVPAAGYGRYADPATPRFCQGVGWRSEEHTYDIKSIIRISYAVFCLKQTNRYT